MPCWSTAVRYSTVTGTILLHFRELEGIPAEVKLSSEVPGRPIKKILEVNVAGQPVGQEISSIQLKPFEVKFIKVDF